jgi:hypothetical protein
MGDFASRFVGVVDDDVGSFARFLAGSALRGSPFGHLQRLSLSVGICDRDFLLPPIDVGHDSLADLQPFFAKNVDFLGGRICAARRVVNDHGRVAQSPSASTPGFLPP